jgi:copper chaperone NosL
MSISSSRFAGQIVAPGEEPRFFDDIGCLAKGAAETLPPGAVAYVADHRTGAWVPARRAVYTRVPGLDTPMGSHLIAHADEASRSADPGIGGGVQVAPGEVFGGSLDRLGGG